MSIPASRKNLLTNSGFEVNAAEWTAHGNCTSATSTTQVYIGTQSLAVIATAAGAVAVATTSGTGGIPVTASTPYNFSAYLRTSVTARSATPQIIWYTSAGALISTSSGTPVTDGFSWLRANVQATSPSNAAFCAVQLTYASEAASEVHYVDACLLEQTATLGAFFNGDTTWDAANFHSYSWSGAQGASTSTEDYYGMWVELATTAGMPSVNVFATGLGGSSVTVQITRSASGDTWTVPGWRARSVIAADTTEDWYVPYGVPVQYNCIVNGSLINSKTITVTSATGWVCDPLQPDQAMPINLTDLGSGTLTLGAAALGKMTYDPHGSFEYPIGGSYPIGRAGQRSAATGVTYALYAHQNDISDQFNSMVMSAPILLFKSLPSWGSIPPLGYTLAPATESPLNRQRITTNYATTYWEIVGDLVMPTTRPPVTGVPTYDDVKTYLGTRTYNSVLAANASRTYVDIKANPLSM